MFGGQVAQTIFDAFDTDGNGNIIAGGSSADTSIVSQASPIVVFICPLPQFLWSKQFPSTHSHVSAVKFNTAGSRALASLNQDPLLLFWLRTSDGAVMNSFQNNNGGFNGILSEGIRFTAGDDFVYLAMENSNHQWALAKISIVDDTTWNTDFFKDSAAPNSRAYSLSFGRDEGEIFVASSFTTLPGGVTTYHRGLVSLDPTGNINWVDAGEVSQYYEVKYLAYADNHVFTVSESILIADTVSLLFTKYALNVDQTAYPNGQIYTFKLENANQIMRCMGMFAPNQGTIVLFTHIEATNAPIFVSIDTTNNNLFTMAQSVIWPFSQNVNKINHVKFTTVDQFKFVGTVKSVIGDTISGIYNPPVGYVMSKGVGESCLEIEAPTGGDGLQQMNIDNNNNPALIGLTGSFDLVVDAFTDTEPLLNQLVKHSFCADPYTSELYPRAQNDIIYTYDLGLQTYPIDTFFFGPSCFTVGDIAYSSLQTDGSALPPYIQFDEAANSSPSIQQGTKLTKTKPSMCD